MAEVRVRCPNCEKSYSIGRQLLGNHVRCRHCGRRFTLTASLIDLDESEMDSTVDHVPPDPLPSTIGRFAIRSRLGAGAFGAVYRAHDPNLDREIAIKVLHADSTDNPTIVGRFLREAQAAARLRHPNIVPVFDTGTDGSSYYIASEFIKGRTLAEVIAGGPMEPRRAAEIVADLASALQAAHDLGIVHRDVKPLNVMIDGDGRPKLMDFGLARWDSSTGTLTQDGTILGTPSYMAPEQASGKVGAVAPASDQYSLGVILYELLCGKVPFAGPLAIVIFNAVHTEPKRPSAIRPKIPGDLETICLKAMAKRPEDRYPGLNAMGEDLAAWLAGRPIAATATLPTLTGPTPERTEAEWPVSVEIEPLKGSVSKQVAPLRVSRSHRRAISACFTLLVVAASGMVIWRRANPEPDGPIVAAETKDKAPGVTPTVARDDVARPDPPAASPTSFPSPSPKSEPTKAGAPRAIPRVPPSHPFYLMLTYTPKRGRLEDLIRAVLAAGVTLNARHRIDVMGHWIIQDDPEGAKRLVVLLGLGDGVHGKASWEDYLATADGKALSALVADLRFRGLNPVEYAPLTEPPRPASLYELRVHEIAPGKLTAVSEFARDQGNALIESHGMEIVCEFTSQSRDSGGYQFIEILRHRDREAAHQAWTAYAKAPEVIALMKATNDFDLVTSSVVTFLVAVTPETLERVAPSKTAMPVVAEPKKAAAAVRKAAAAKKAATPRPLTNSVGMKFCFIGPGRATLGSSADDPTAYDQEKPPRDFVLEQPFYLAECEVTQEQFRRITGRSPSRFAGEADLPVESVTRREAFEFCNRLSLRERIAPYYAIQPRPGPLGEDEIDVVVEVLGGSGYRLPTRDEWEYACRAGTTTRYFFGDEPTRLGEFAWFAENSGDRTHPVGLKAANPLGLKDMYGNVWELVDIAPGRPSDANVFCGGAYPHPARGMRSASHSGGTPTKGGPHVGFRVARTLVP